MIPAFDPGIGLKDERPLPRALPSREPGFDLALHRASVKPHRATERPLDDARPRADARDTRARRLYGKSDAAAGRATHAPDRKPGTAKASGDTKASDDAAPTATGQHGTRQAKDADGKPAQQGTDGVKHSKDKQDPLSTAALERVASAPAQPKPETAEQAADALGANGVQVVYADTQPVHDPSASTPVSVQIGAAAYRLGVHGQGEAELAAANGVILPGSPQAQLGNPAVGGAIKAALQKSEHAEIAKLAEDDGQHAPDVLQFSDAAKAMKAAKHGGHQAPALDSAQARNDLLQQLTNQNSQGAAGGQSNDSAWTQQAGSGALHNLMRPHGLQVRDARVQTLQNSAATNAAQVAPAGTFSLTSGAPLAPLHKPPGEDTGDRQLIERVATEARWLIANDRQEVSLRLSPEHLGSLHMKVEHKDGVFQVHLTVDTQAAKHLLEANLADLRNRLTADQPGGQFLFNVDVRQGNEQPGFQARTAHTAAVGGVAGAGPGTEAAPAAAARPRGGGQAGLSIYA